MKVSQVTLMCVQIPIWTLLATPLAVKAKVNGQQVEYGVCICTDVSVYNLHLCVKLTATVVHALG